MGKVKQKRVWPPVVSSKDIFSYGIFGIVILINILFVIFFQLSFFDFVVSVTGVLYVAVLARRNILNFGIGMLNVVLYVILCYQTKLYGEALFYCIDFVLIFPAFIEWRRTIKENKEETGQALKVSSKKLKLWWYAVMPFAIAAFTYGYGLLLSLIGGEYYFWDALSSGVTFVATILAWKQFREQWIGWMFVYVVSIILWAVAGNVLMIVMSAGCLTYSVKGFVEWWIQSKIHEMHLEEAHFLSIKSRRKKVETRLYDEKRKQIRIGDMIIYTSRATGETVRAKVKNLHIYKTFEELFCFFSAADLGYQEGRKANHKDMEKYYSREKQEKYGVVAIEIRVIPKKSRKKAAPKVCKN